MLNEEKQTVGITFEVELDCDFDPFKGKTLQQFAEVLNDDLVESLIELHPAVKEVYTRMTQISENVEHYE